MHLLVALDDSAPSWEGLEYALTEHPEDEHTVVHAVDPTDSAYGEAAHLGTQTVLENRREQATALFEEARDRAAAHGCSIATETVLGQPASAIVDYAEDNDVDRIVVGSHGRTGVSRVLLGSVAERIARQASVPVTIVR